MHSKGIQFNGDSLEAQHIPVLNTTGADLVLGGVYALDLAQELAATSGNGNPVKASLTNINATTANNLNGILVVCDKVILAGESGMVVISGATKVRVNGTVALTDRLKAVAAQNYLQATSQAAGSTDVGVGKPLETNAAGPNLKKVLFDGVAFKGAINGATT
jgi:hypothetical protein